MVCEVQYGGRITDELDRELFQAYGHIWVTDACFQPNYCFNAQVTEFNYHIPDASEHQRFIEYIQKMPGNDTPAIFGLHPNADLTFRLKESSEMIDTLLDIQPKDSGGGGGGKSREEEINERLKVLKGPRGLGEAGRMDLIPLNIFLGQELQRFQMILTIVKSTMQAMIDAIDGSISMTPEIVESINAVFDFRVPRKFQYDPTGAEISWLTVSLAGWIKGLIDRHH